MVPFLISPRLCKTTKEECCTVFHSQQRLSHVHDKDTGAHLLCDVKLRPIGVTQSKLLRARQRPAENTRSARVSSTNKRLNPSPINPCQRNRGTNSKPARFTAVFYSGVKNRAQLEVRKAPTGVYTSGRNRETAEEKYSVGVEQQSAKYELFEKGKKKKKPGGSGQVERRGGAAALSFSSPSTPQRQIKKQLKFGVGAPLLSPPYIQRLRRQGHQHRVMMLETLNRLFQHILLIFDCKSRRHFLQSFQFKDSWE